MSQPFRVGQRVRLLSPAYIIPQGRIGTIIRVYPLFQGLYEVRFDRDTRTRLIYGVHLEAVEHDSKD